MWPWSIKVVVLTVAMLRADQPLVTFQEFNSAEACEAAREIVINNVDRGPVTYFDAQCIVK